MNTTTPAITTTPIAHERLRGMLLSGACGDALGAPVEFQQSSRILTQYGGPIRNFNPAYGRVGAITDDTQMLLWTAEGLIRYDNARRAGTDMSVAEVVRRAYLRWYGTQHRSLPDEVSPADGWLWDIEELHSSRAPGTTCLGGLSNSIHSGRIGTMEDPIHSGDGCGAIMRIAPVAAFFTGDEAFHVGIACGALSHGERGAVLAAGFFAALLAETGRGMSMEESINGNLARISAIDGHQRLTSLVTRAVDLAAKRPGTIDGLESLGGAWRGDEALALTIYAALSVPDNLEEAMIFSVTHSGDSDSTGSLVGNLLGLQYPDGLPSRWIENLEIRDEITQVADDLYAHTNGEAVNDIDRYPAH